MHIEKRLVPFALASEAFKPGDRVTIGSAFAGHVPRTAAGELRAVRSCRGRHA